MKGKTEGKILAREQAARKFEEDQEEGSKTSSKKSSKKISATKKKKTALSTNKKVMKKNYRPHRKDMDIPSRKELPKKVEDVHRTDSDLKGIWGTMESFLRKFRNLAVMILMAPIAFLYIFCLSVSFFPMIALFQWTANWTLEWQAIYHYMALALSVGIGVFLFGASMLIVVPIVNFCLPFRTRPCKGGWYSLQVIPWYYHNALVQLVRYTVLEFVNPSMINIWYFRAMGMKIGKGVVINTSNISDPCLITLEDYVTLGGNATIFAHYGMKGYLIIAETKIKKGTTIGLKASVMGDVVVGENVMVPAHCAIMPKTRIPDNAKSW